MFYSKFPSSFLFFFHFSCEEGQLTNFLLCGHKTDSDTKRSTKIQKKKRENKNKNKIQESKSKVAKTKQNIAVCVCVERGHGISARRSRNRTITTASKAGKTGNTNKCHSTIFMSLTKVNYTNGPGTPTLFLTQFIYVSRESRVGQKTKKTEQTPPPSLPTKIALNTNLDKQKSVEFLVHFEFGWGSRLLLLIIVVIFAFGCISFSFWFFGPFSSLPPQRFIVVIVANELQYLWYISISVSHNFNKFFFSLLPFRAGLVFIYAFNFPCFEWVRRRLCCLWPGRWQGQYLSALSMSASGAFAIWVYRLAFWVNFVSWTFDAASSKNSFITRSHHSICLYSFCVWPLPFCQSAWPRFALDSRC